MLHTEIKEKLNEIIRVINVLSDAMADLHYQTQDSEGYRAPLKLPELSELE